jgi:plastocyanin
MMKTTSFIPVSVILFSIILVGCSAATNAPAATNTPTPGGAGTVDIAIKGFAFDPPSITIKAGTTVRWVNQDSANHTITSDSGAWDSGGIAQGESFTRVFDTVGTFTYHCTVHPSMKGTIIVTS